MLDAMPPLPEDAEDQARWVETSRRRRIMSGRWEALARATLREHLGAVRETAIGRPDLSSNILRSVCNELGIHHDDGAILTGDDAAGVALLQVELDRAGWSPMAQTWVRELIACREMLVRVHVPPDPGAPVMLRQVYPDTVVACSSPDSPSIPVEVEELRYREGYGWTWDCLSVEGAEEADEEADPADERRRPYYRVLSQDRKTDLSREILGGDFTGPNYPYRDADGRPILPYVLYHAQVGNCLWRPWDGVELVEATLNAAVLWTHLGHGIRNAAWPQRYMIDAEVSGGAPDMDTGSRSEVVADPAVILAIETVSADGNVQGRTAQVGAFPVAFDALDTFEVAVRYERKAAVSGGGVSASDVERMEGDPRSGLALALSTDGKTRAARRYTEAIRRGDVELARIVACLLNRTRGTSLPESGFGVTYPGVPESMIARGVAAALTGDAPREVMPQRETETITPTQGAS